MLVNTYSKTLQKKIGKHYKSQNLFFNYTAVSAKKSDESEGEKDRDRRNKT